jgi:hypothetical protein
MKPDQRTLLRTAAGIGLLLMVFLVAALWTRVEAAPVRASAGPETVVVAQPSDPYYPLAQKIAAQEHLPLAADLIDGNPDLPRYVILVASPASLTEERLAHLGRFFQNNDYSPAVGIISGATIEAAEQLWNRRNQPQVGKAYIAGDVDVLQRVFTPTIVNISGGANTTVPLTKAALLDSLTQASYVYWTRHSGGSTWYWNEAAESASAENELHASDLPQLQSLVVYSPTCAVFRPWLDQSIALGFVDHGAAAFLGFINSPHTSSFSKNGLAAPGLTTWADFPLGLAAQVQNKAITNMVYQSPQLFMLGDPRTNLSKEPPYLIRSDAVTADGKRVIEVVSDQQGVLAIKLQGAAEYPFIAVPGRAAISDKDLFFNSRLQTLRVGADRYLLYLHSGGSFRIELSRQAPFGWVIGDALVDGLDYGWVIHWVNPYADSNPHLYLGALFLLAVILIIQRLIRKKSLGSYRGIFLAALLIALLRLAYGLLRLNQFTITNDQVVYRAADWLTGFGGIFACLAGGLILIKDSRRVIVKILGFLLAVARPLWMTLFYALFLTLINNVPQVTGMTNANVWNYRLFEVSLIPLAVEALIVLILVRWVSIHKRESQSQPLPAKDGFSRPTG